MSLIQVLFSETVADFNLRAVAAGDAAEMESRVRAQIAAAIVAGEQLIADFKLAGAGSGPGWQGWIVTGESTSETLPVSEANVVAVVAGSVEELYPKLIAAIAAVPNAEDIYKIEIAGAGDGHSYMAVALFEVEEG